MTLGETLLKSYRDLRQGWVRLADSTFGRALPEADEMARGEFISAFIYDPGRRASARQHRQEAAN